MATIRDDVLRMAQAVGEGQLAMRIVHANPHFYFASEELHSTAARLADSRMGREILAALGRVTLQEPIEPAELPIGWLLQRPPPLRSGSQSGLSGVDPTATWTKGGAER